MQETQEMWVQSLGQKGPLEKKTAACSSITAWKIPPTEVPGRLQSTGSQRVRNGWGHTRTHTGTYYEYPVMILGLILIGLISRFHFKNHRNMNLIWISTSISEEKVYEDQTYDFFFHCIFSYKETKTSV